MRTILFAPELFTGGGGIPRILRLYLKAICELSKDGDPVAFLSLNDRLVDSSDLKRYTNASLVEWEICDKNKFAFARAGLRMGRKADRIVCGHVAQLPLAWAAARLNPSAKYYLIAHGIEVWRSFTFLERVALRGATGVWCVSDFTRRRVLEHISIPEDRLKLLPNALDPFLSPQLPPSPSTGAPYILSISRLSTADGYKGIDHLIESMPSVLRQIPDARLRIVGRGDGFPGLQGQVRKLDLSNSVEFLGYRSDAELSEEYARCRLFALPSEKEGFGLVYLEAMAHGRPCLAARSGGAPEVVTGETGVLVEYGNISNIASTIVSALRREWPLAPLLERADAFSYLRFKERLASLISA